MGGVAVGAVIGGFVAAVRGGNPIKGAIIGGALGFVGGQIAGAAGGEAGGVIAGEAGGYAAGAEALTAEAGGVAGAIGAEEFAAAALAPELAAAGASEVASASLIDPVAGTVSSDIAGATLEGAVPGAIDQTAAEQIISQGGAAPPAPTPGQINTGVNAPGGASWNAGPFDQAGTAGTADPGLWEKTKLWAKTHPQIAAAVIQAGGGLVTGLGVGAGQYLTMEKKAELELQNKEALISYYRQFVQSSSAGGKNVSLGISAPATTRPLRTTSGGLVRRSMIV